MKALLAGDWHGSTTAMRRALQFAQKNKCDVLIQVGDFGYGWATAKDSTPEKERCWFSEKCSVAAQAYEIPIFWIDGNHEHFDRMEKNGLFWANSVASIPVEYEREVVYVPRGTLMEFDGKKILFCGGAYSVDKAARWEGTDWFAQEEITQADIDVCAKAGKVDVVIAHDVCHTGYVAGLAADMNGMGVNERFPMAKPNRMALETIREVAQPELWVHGHYHHPYEVQVGDTRFIGLDFESNAQALRVIDLARPFDRTNPSFT